ncbi:GtrA family protein [Pseudorhizobium sp. NPDC055634]
MTVELFRYLSVGVFNTSVSLTLIYASMYLGVGDVLANLLGYSIGIVISYVMNSIWTFRAKATKNSVIKYLCLVGTCYVANLAAMTFARDVFLINSYFAQLFGMCTYTFCGYIGSRFYVFARQDSKRT